MLTLLLYFHVAISLVAIVAGLIVLKDFLAGGERGGPMALFLATTAVTLVTGFLFPITVFTPALGVGIVASLVLLATLAARYLFHANGRWRAVFVIGAVLSLWFNLFVLVVQAFQKLPFLNALAPTGSEPPFAMAQGLVLLATVLAGYLALRRYHPA